MTLHLVRSALICLFIASVCGWGFYEMQVWKRGKE